MNEPKREELSRLAYSVMKLRFTQLLRSGRVNYGFKVIPDLRSLGEQKKGNYILDGAAESC